MKWSSVLSASTIVASVFAGPLASKRDDNQYYLRISTDFKELNGKFLSGQDNAVGIYNEGELESAQQVTVVAAAGSHSVSLRPHPVGINEHALGLTGSDGVLDFTDLADPKDEEETYSWKDFKLGDSDKGDHELLWGSSNVTPGWVAWPSSKGGYKIKHYDSSKGAIVTQDFIPVKIVLEAAMTIA